MLFWKQCFEIFIFEKKVCNISIQLPGPWFEWASFQTWRRRSGCCCRRVGRSCRSFDRSGLAASVRRVQFEHWPPPSQPSRFEPIQCTSWNGERQQTEEILAERWVGTCLYEMKYRCSLGTSKSRAWMWDYRTNNNSNCVITVLGYLEIVSRSHSFVSIKGNPWLTIVFTPVCWSRVHVGSVVYIVTVDSRTKYQLGLQYSNEYRK